MENTFFFEFLPIIFTFVILFFSTSYYVLIDKERLRNLN